MNIGHENKKVWKKRQVQIQEGQVKDQQELHKDKNVSTIMLSGFVIGNEESIVSLDNDSSQYRSLNDTLF